VNSDPPVAFSYYDDGSVKNITRSGDSPLAYHYLLSGQKAQVLYPNNARINYNYDDQGRLTSVTNRKPDMSILSSYTYGYDYDYTTSSYTMKGSRTSMTNHLAQIEKYYFDNLYQLTRVDYGNGDVHQWSYDDIGNRVQQVVIPSGQPPVVTNYAFYQNDQGRNSQLLQSDGLSTYTWDNNGNLSAKASTNYAWDYDNRLIGISGPSVSASYVYGENGKRLKKNIGGIETTFLYGLGKIVKETTGGNATNFLQGSGIDRPAMMDKAGARVFYFADGLGSIRQLTDAAGVLQNSYEYGAWGELRSQDSVIPNPYGYTGREFSENELIYYRARYLDSRLGRFCSEDPLKDLKTLNYYAYVGNDPINWTDPDALLRRPVPGPIRPNDGHGSGVFLDPRDGGTRRHMGVDLVGFPGDNVMAPHGGFAGRGAESAWVCYNFRSICCDDGTKGFLRLCWVLVHIDPDTMLPPGDPPFGNGNYYYANEGDVLGTIKNSDWWNQRFPGVTPHVHVELRMLNTCIPWYPLYSDPSLWF
jgi:RHS repeat-associated protein